MTDTQLQSVHAFDPELTPLFTYGQRADEELNNPCGVVVDRYGNVLVADKAHSSVHLLDRRGRRKTLLLTWEDGIVEPQALALTHDGRLVLSEASTGVVKIFSYTHLPQVHEEDAAAAQTLNDTVVTNDDGVSLKSDKNDDDQMTRRKQSLTKNKPLPGIASKAPEKTSSTVDVASFQRSLELLNSDSGAEGGRAALNRLQVKSGWSQLSSNQFSSVPSTAAPRRGTGAAAPAASAKQRLAQLNQEYVEASDTLTELRHLPAVATNLDAHGMSASTPNIRSQSPATGLLADGGKHLSDVTRPLFTLHVDTSRSSEALSSNRTAQTHGSIHNPISSVSTISGTGASRVSLV